jgi:ubiquitin C-terminal hydrolase
MIIYNPLNNLGQTCYINSIIQSLFSLNLIKYPSDLNKFVNNIYNKTNFRRHEQGDPHEFLLFILDYINDSTAVRMPIINKLSDSYMNLYTTGFTIKTPQKGYYYLSNITHLIGQTVSVIKYKNDEKSIAFESFRVLELNIYKGANNLYDLLDNYIKCEKFEDGILKKTLFYRTPRILIIYLVRNQIHFINGNINYTKDNTLINIPPELNIKNYIYESNINNISTYKLKSITHHYGVPQRGHCNSSCYNNNNLVLCDDNNITNINNYSSDGAYILYYIGGT